MLPVKDCSDLQKFDRFYVAYQSDENKNIQFGWLHNNYKYDDLCADILGLQGVTRRIPTIISYNVTKFERIPSGMKMRIATLSEVKKCKSELAAKWLGKKYLSECNWMHLENLALKHEMIIKLDKLEHRLSTNQLLFLLASNDNDSTLAKSHLSKDIVTYVLKITELFFIKHRERKNKKIDIEKINIKDLIQDTGELENQENENKSENKESINQDCIIL